MTDQKAVHSRIRLLLGFCLLMLAIFIVRLFQLQIIDNHKYLAMALDEQVKRLVIPAERGEIYVMDDTVPVKAVLNEAVFTVFVDPVEVENSDEIVSALKKIAGGNLVTGNIKQLAEARPSRYQIVARNVTQKQAELLKGKHLAGLGFQQTTRRVYPEGHMAAQVLGFVNAEEKGQYGVEEALQDRLKGKDGLLESVTDVSNIPLTIGGKYINKAPQHGDNIVLTIDRNIQSYSEQALLSGVRRIGADHASAIVVDPQTGKVLAMANYPSYDPSKFYAVRDGSAFNNSTITAPYEPGSVMKTFTVATGLDRGVITPSSTYVNTDRIQIDDRVIENATKGQTGTITIQHALNWSLNTGMVTVAERLGDGKSITRGARDTMYHYLHNKFKLGELTGIELAGEAQGEIIPPTNPEGNAVRYSNMSFGQGMNLTMLQVAAGFSAIVNGGTYHTPTVIEGVMGDDGNLVEAPAKESKQILSSIAAKKAKKMVHDARAAFYSANDKPGYDIGGKTGTSQTLINNSYNNNQTVGTYLGYGGDKTARYVIMVQVSGKGKAFAGNLHAMPIFTDISNWMIDYKKLQPRG